MALDEATALLLEQMASTGARPLHEMTLDEARGLSSALGALSGDGPEMAQVRDTRVRCGGGAIPIRLLAPTDSPSGVIVYYHGGGWMVGTVDDIDTLGRELAHRTRCAVVLVGYRLAPEYRYPTAVEDAWAAVRWVSDHVKDIAGDSVPLIVAGDSAGGNLAAVVAQRARSCDEVPVSLQILVNPVVDCDLNTTSSLDPSNQLMLSRDTMAWFWDSYAPDAASRVHPEASPLRLPILSGLPPAVILTAEHDVLRDEGELYAASLMKAGVPVKHRRCAGQMHGFFTLFNLLPGGAAGMQFVAEAVAERLAEEGPKADHAS